MKGIEPNVRGVKCTNCGPNSGTSANIGQGGLRCGDCGRFAEPCPTYCAKHDIYWGGLTGYRYCPKCREVERVEQERQEMMARRSDPRMHPTVDARRY